MFTELSLCIIQVFQRAISHLLQTMGRKPRLSVHWKNEECKKVKRAKVCVCITQPQVAKQDHHTTTFIPPLSPGMYEYSLYK